MSALAAFVEQRPRAAFAAFAALHLGVWTALPTALYGNLPLDLIEALTYGREWQLGYDKLPPLPWWLVEIAYRLFGRDVAYYAMSQLAVVAALALVFATARPLVGGAGALVAVLIVDGLHYFNYTAAKFNHDVIELPFWALAGFAFRSGLRSGRNADWVLLGLAIGLAWWAKYFVVVLAVPLALFVLIDRDARRALRTPGPWLALATALVVMAPHLAWLVANDFLPFAYASARASGGLNPLTFALSQLLFLVPALAIAAPLVSLRGPASAPRVEDFDRRIVAVLAFGPAATIFAASLITGRGLIAMWGYPLWLFLGLWIVLTARAVIDRRRLARVAALWAGVTAVFAMAFAVNYTVPWRFLDLTALARSFNRAVPWRLVDFAALARFEQRYRAASFPGDRLAAELSERFRAATGRPLRYTIGTMWLGGNVEHYSPDHPRVLIDGNPSRAPWIDLADLEASGAVTLWTDGDLDVVPADLRAAAPAAQVQPPLGLPFRRGDRVARVGWAIVPPQQ